LIFSPFNTEAQQPSHFILGEEELSGVNIYDLIQDHNGDYWIATNNGIYKYDNYSIKKIECEDMTSSSVFNLIEDNHHNVYCHNLSGQIFQLKGDSCSVYFNIPDSLMSHEISYQFDNINQLTLATNKLFQVSKQKEVTFITDQNISTMFEMYKDVDSNLVFYNSYSDELSKLKNGNYTITKTDLSPHLIPSSVFHKNSVIVYDTKTGNVIPEISSNLDSNLPNFKYHNNYTNYRSDNTNFWVSNLSGGIYIFDHNLEPQNNYEPLFDSNVISSFLKDNEGNIILGTFGNGLIVIPNLDILDIELNSPSTKVTKLTSSSANSIFFGTQEGEIFKIDSLNKTTQIKGKGIQQIEILEYLPNINSLLFNGISKNILTLSNSKTFNIHDGSIKDAYRVNENQYIFATNTGVSLFNSQYLNKPESKKRIKSLQPFRGRAYCIGSDSNTKSIYCGSALGLKIGTMDSIYFFELNGESVLCKDVLNVDNTILITSKKHGVLIFKNDVLVDQWNTENGLLSNSTKLIKVYDDKLYLSTDVGLNILNKNGKVLNSINKSNGLNANNIVDFEVVNGYLWILTNKGIQKIKLDKIANTDYSASIEIANIRVNEELIDTVQHTFNHAQKKFVFDISSKSLKYQNDIYYQYQLVGIDKNWIINSYKDHIIEYKSLPPNKYTFKVKAIHKFKESEIIYYSFIIKKPYWERWWFYLIIIFSFLLITFTLFRIQINRQRRKTLLQNQLSLTQLTALKSQMNPHFIFNSLNSIQDLILQQDRENAYNYISKFALLVRKILHHSDKDFIEFEEEVKILEVYLELEELRFKKDFSFTIETNAINDIDIPPMLIQPFVENALKHGLLHKKGKKILSIIFNLANDILTCEITDNGIGREKSQEIKQRQKKTHDSFSVKSIKTRFDILKDLYGQDIGVKFDDLTTENKVIGTKVTLKIPFKRRF